MTPDDPDVESKAAVGIGCLSIRLTTRQFFAVGEKTAMQPLNRLDPGLPLSADLAERHGFEYYRHGHRRSSPR